MTSLTGILNRIRKKVIREYLYPEINDLTKPRLYPYPFNIKDRARARKLVVVPIESFGSLILEDATPNFDLISYSYTGDSHGITSSYFENLKAIKHLSFKTEFFGQSLSLLVDYITKEPCYDLILILNGDVMTSVSSINACLFVAEKHGLDVFQPSLSLDSFYSHKHLLNKPGLILEEVEFTEVMMLGLSMRALNALKDENQFPISSYGIDTHLLPFIIKRNNWSPPCVVHMSIARHCRPVESSDMTFSNGKSAMTELKEMANKYPKQDLHSN